MPREMRNSHKEAIISDNRSRKPWLQSLAPQKHFMWLAWALRHYTLYKASVLFYEAGSHRDFLHLDHTWVLQQHLAEGSSRAAWEWQKHSDHSNQPSRKGCSPMHRSGNCHKTTRVLSQIFNADGGKGNGVGITSLKNSASTQKPRLPVCVHSPRPDGNTSLKPPSLFSKHLRQTNGTTFNSHKQKTRRN